MKTIKTRKTNPKNKNLKNGNGSFRAADANHPDAASTIDVLLHLQELAKRFGFGGVLTQAERIKTAHARLDPAFTQAAASAVEAYAPLLGGDFDAALLRSDLGYVAGLASVASAAGTLARSIEDAILVKKKEIARTSDAIFAAVKAKSMTPNGAVLSAAAAELAALRKRAPRGKQAKPPSAPPAKAVQAA